VRIHGHPRHSVIAAGAVVCLLGISSAAGASTHHKGITQAKAAKQYLADVKPVNAANIATHVRAQGATTPTALGKAASPWIAAMGKFDSLVLRQQWPSSVKADIKALVVADSAVVGDWNAMSGSSAFNISALTASISRDQQTSSIDATIVRSDLGLMANNTTSHSLRI
jgi:hypothetical protein